MPINLTRAQQIVGPEPREACFASSVIRPSYAVAPWPGQLRRYAAIAQNAYETFSSTDFDFSSDAFSEQLSLCQTMAWDRASAVDSS